MAIKFLKRTDTSADFKEPTEGVAAEATGRVTDVLPYAAQRTCMILCVDGWSAERGARCAIA